MEKKEEKLTFSDKLGKWILKNRVILISILVVLFVGGVVSATAFSAVKYMVSVIPFTVFTPLYR